MRSSMISRVLPLRPALPAAIALCLVCLPRAAHCQDEAESAPGAKKPIIDFSSPEDLLRRGGYLLWPIVACSVVTVTFGLERFVRLRRGRVIPFFFVRGFQSRLKNKEFDRASAIEFCERNRSPMARIHLAAVRHWGRSAREIEQVIITAGQREIALLKRNLRTLQASGNVATLFGLLGTVVGMIQAFNDVAVHKGLGKAEVLAGGIAQALLTTAGGLTVAIPSLILFHYFAGRVERLVYDMDTLASEVVLEIATERKTESTARDAPTERIQEPIST